MTELGRVFLQEAAVGMAVTLTLATGKEKTGTIRSVEGSIVRLSSSTGVLTLSAESLLCYEVLSGLPDEKPAETSAAPVSVVDAVIQEIDRNGSIAFAAKPQQPDLAQWQQRIRECGESASEAGRCLESLKNAIRVNELDAKFGRTDKVAMGLRMVMEKDPSCRFLSGLLGSVYELAGKDAQAADAYRAAGCFRESYQAALRAGDLERQREALLELLSKEPGDSALYHRFFYLCGRSGQPAAAAKLYERVEKDASPEVRALLCRGLMYLAAKAEALPPLQEPAISPENLSALYEAVRALASAEKPKQEPEEEQKPQEEKAPAGLPEAPEGYQSGRITALKNGFGFIDGNIFFGFHAVTDEALRGDLWDGVGTGYAVCYHMSSNEKGDVAVDIERLAEPGKNGGKDETEAPEEKPVGLTEAPEGYQIGRITALKNGFGFIDGNIFFGFHAVADEELRERLRAGEWIICPVCYRMGANERGACAVDVWRMAETSGPARPAKPEPGLSEMAQKALESGDEIKALSIFQQALKNDALTDGAVADLAMLYSRRGEHLEAEALLQRYAGRLSEEKRLNLLITIYDKAGRYEELVSTLDKAIAAAGKLNTRMHYMMRKANVLSGSLNRPADAIGVYEALLETRRENAKMLGLPENEGAGASGTVGAIKRSIAFCHYRLGNQEMAKRYAEELLRANPEEEFARGIVEGTLDPETRPGDLISLSREGDSPAEIGNLSAFITNRLNGCELKNYIDIRRVNLLNDTFKGTAKQAESTVRDLLGKLSSQKPRARSESLMVAAKIVSQFAGETADGFASVRNFRNLIGRSLVSSGDNLLASVTAQPDVMRFYYLESIKFLSPGEQDRQNALVRYLYSFFRELRDVPLEITGRRNLSLSQDFAALLAQEEQIDGYTLADAVTALLTSSPAEHSELCALIAQREPVARQVCECLASQLGRPAPAACGQETLSELFAETVSRRQKNLEQFQGTVRLLGSYSFNQRWLDEHGAALTQCRIYPVLPALERERIDQVSELFAQSRKYVDSADFEIRESTLRSILWQCEEQQGRILESPTELAFEHLLPLFAQCAALVTEELRELYQNNRPEIEISLVTGNLVLAPGGDTLDVQINIKNAAQMQAADNLRFSLPDQSKYYLAGPVEMRKRYIKGGESNTYILRLTLTKELLGAKAFSLLMEVGYEYRCFEGTQGEAIQKSFSINLSDAGSFKKIHNPYAPHIESGVVSDARMFYGRDKEIGDIIQMLFNEDGTPLRSKSIILYGQKRTGKSSLLYHLGRRIEEHRHAILVNMGDISSMADLSSGASRLLMDERFFQAFCYILFDNLQNELYTRHPELIARMEEVDLAIPLDEMLDTAANHTLLFNRFFTNFNRLLDSGENAGKYSVILLIDEFTYVYSWIQQGILSRDFMKFWKGIIQDLKLVGILVGQDYMPDFIAAVPNTFGSTEKHRVTYLTEENALRLIEEPVMLIDPDTFAMESRYKEGATSRILELTAGSAYYTMILCDRLVRYLNEKSSTYVTDADVDELLYTNMLSGVSMLKKDYFDPLYNDEGCFDDAARSEDNLTLLRAIAQCCGRDSRCLISAVRCPQLSEERRAMLLEQLEKRDVIEITEGKYCRIKVGLFKEWLLA